MRFHRVNNLLCRLLHFNTCYTENTSRNVNYKCIYNKKAVFEKIYVGKNETFLRIRSMVVILPNLIEYVYYAN